MGNFWSKGFERAHLKNRKSWITVWHKWKISLSFDLLLHVSFHQPFLHYHPAFFLNAFFLQTISSLSFCRLFKLVSFKNDFRYYFTVYLNAFLIQTIFVTVKLANSASPFKFRPVKFSHSLIELHIFQIKISLTHNYRNRKAETSCSGSGTDC